ncbi:dihydropteroate synthase [Mariniluteicoccus flavus]
MGILNVTPDSFSDGGDWFDHDTAIAHGLELAARGADIIDVGGESTRPGISRTTAAEELRRVLPVVTALAAERVAVSVDTMRAEVARATVAAGATMINDVSGGLADPDMLPVVADLDVPYIAMHWRAHSTTMQDLATYEDVVADVRRELAERVDAALAAGVREARLVVDPGIGFAKTAGHNWELLRRLDEIESLGLPVLVGVSRKRFLGELLATSGTERAPKRRDAATAAITTVCAQRRVWAVRTHSVRDQCDAIAVVERLRGDVTDE